MIPSSGLCSGKGLRCAHAQPTPMPWDEAFSVCARSAPTNALARLSGWAPNAPADALARGCPCVLGGGGGQQGPVLLCDTPQPPPFPPHVLADSSGGVSHQDQL